MFIGYMYPHPKILKVCCVWMGLGACSYTSYSTLIISLKQQAAHTLLLKQKRLNAQMFAGLFIRTWLEMIENIISMVYPASCCMAAGIASSPSAIMCCISDWMDGSWVSTVIQQMSWGLIYKRLHCETPHVVLCLNHPFTLRSLQITQERWRVFHGSWSVVLSVMSYGSGIAITM